MRPVKIMIPFGPGSTPDLVGRLIADRLQQKLGQPFVVEDKPGASGNIGTDAVAKADPDGYTLGISIGGPLAINPMLFYQDALRPEDRPRDRHHDRDAAERARGQCPARGQFGRRAHRTAQENPGKYNFGSIGNGSLSHLAMAALALKSGTEIVHIPYASSPQAMTALIRGDVDIVCLPAISVTPHVASGDVKILAVSTAARSPLLPDVPTLEGSRHRRRSRRVDGPDCAGEDTGSDRRTDRPRGRRRDRGTRHPREARGAARWSRSRRRRPSSAPASTPTSRGGRR